MGIHSPSLDFVPGLLLRCYGWRRTLYTCLLKSHNNSSLRPFFFLRIYLNVVPPCSFFTGNFLVFSFRFFFSCNNDLSLSVKIAVFGIYLVRWLMLPMNDLCCFRDLWDLTLICLCFCNFRYDAAFR